MGDFLPLPDIGADLDRVPVGSTESPTTSTPSSNNESTLLPSPLPTTLAPVTQAPSSLAPSSLAPTSSSPITPSPTTLSPITPSPTTTEPSISVTSLSPTTSSPTLIIGCPEDAKICPDGTVVSREGPDCNFPECPPTETRTVYSCPPPKPQTITTQNENGTDVTIIIEPSISTVRITYGFQMITSDEEEELEDLLPEFENQLESSLGTYYSANTEVDEGEDDCGGYIIDDFRRQQRRLLGMKRQRRARAEDVVEQETTKIIGISTAQDLAIAEDQDCVPQNTENCHVIIGSVDATYVGTNEAGVTSSISRAVKQEVDDNNPETSEIVVQYLGTQDDTSEGGGFTLADTVAMAKNVASNWQEAMPERTGNEQLTPLGMGIMIALGSAFAMVVLVLFFKSDDKSSEKKKSKKEALVEYDDERQTDEGQSYCYDLESVAISNGTNDSVEDGIEIRSTVYSGSDCDKTKRISNCRADDMRYNDIQKMESLIEEEQLSSQFGSEDDTDDVVQPSSGGMFSRKSSSNKGERSQTPLVDRVPSLMESPSSPNSPVHQLPSISEAELPPPMNDTPHILPRPRSKKKKSKEEELKESEEEEWEV